MSLIAASYLLPLKATTPQDNALALYIQRLSQFVDDVLVVDGSPSDVFMRHAQAWGKYVRHLRPEVETPMGKVGNVMTGLRHARHERVVIADDDVRYDETTLRRAVALLDNGAVVRPQNYYHPLPWHARWDTGRILLNRVSGGDWSGTLAVRRSNVIAAGGYRGDVLFENLELVRTIRAAGGREICALDLFVMRRPPRTRQFFNQRVRQAFDEWARPARLFSQLAILPVIGALLGRRRGRELGLGTLITIAAAEAGRRRAGGQLVFRRTASLFAPLWVAERALTSWMALAARIFFGGITYRGNKIKEAATPLRQLRRTHATVSRETYRGGVDNKTIHASQA